MKPRMPVVAKGESVECLPAGEKRNRVCNIAQEPASVSEPWTAAATRPHVVRRPERPFQWHSETGWPSGPRRSIDTDDMVGEEAHRKTVEAARGYLSLGHLKQAAQNFATAR